MAQVFFMAGRLVGVNKCSLGEHFRDKKGGRPASVVARQALSKGQSGVPEGVTITHEELAANDDRSTTFGGGEGRRRRPRESKGGKA